MKKCTEKKTVILMNKIKQEVKSFFQFNNNYHYTTICFCITSLVCFVSYSAFIVYGFVSPDGMLEGMHFYINRHWAIGGCGRWFLALMNMIHANLVFPWLTIIECIIVNWLSAHTICKIFKIDNKIYYYLSCILFAILPPFIEMFTYTYMVFPYCISIFFSVIYVYINLRYTNKLILISALFLGCAMGSYQSQIGVAVGLILMIIIKKILDSESDLFSFILRSFISGVLGAAVYIVGLNICLKIFNLELYSRAASFSLYEMFVNFVSRFLYTYKIFFQTFNQITLKRVYIFIFLLIVMCFEAFYIVYTLLKNKNYKILIMFIVLFLLIPPSLNFVGILLPSFDITPLMLLPNYLIIPFTLYLSKYIDGLFFNILKVVFVVCFSIISWTYVLSANATYDAYRFSYNVYKTQMSNALDKVFELDDYQLNSTRIIIIGRPTDTILREKVNTYNYAINLYNNLLYWGSTDLDFLTTNRYLINEFGVDPGKIEYDEYVQFVNLNECIDMPRWPSEGSVQMIDGNAVIKFCEVYE